MNAKQEAKLNMFRATEKHVDDNAAIIASNSAFQTAFNKFKANKIAITNTAQLKGVALTGITADKMSSKLTLCQLAADIVGVIYAYASTNSNNTLKQEMNISVSKLLRTRDSELAPRCQNIHDKVTANLAALTDYGITAALLTNLQTAINNYSAETPKPRTALSGRKTANANLAALFKENDTILKDQLDKLAELFKTDNPDFVKTYESNRIIVDSAKTTTQLKGVVTNKSDNTPIKGATVTIVETGANAITNSKGEYSIKPAPIGEFTVRVTANGFQDLEMDEIGIKLGDTNILNLEIVR